MVLRDLFMTFFFFKQKTAYEMRISDWSSDVCSSDLADLRVAQFDPVVRAVVADDAGDGAEHRTGGLVGAGLAAQVVGDDLLHLRVRGRGFAVDVAADLTQIGRAHVCTPVTNAHIVCRLLLEKKKQQQQLTTSISVTTQIQPRTS